MNYPVRNVKLICVQALRVYGERNYMGSHILRRDNMELRSQPYIPTDLDNLLNSKLDGPQSQCGRSEVQKNPFSLPEFKCNHSYLLPQVYLLIYH